MQKFSQYQLVFLLPLALGGCANPLKLRECDANYLKEQRAAGELYPVRIQVCVPTTKVFFKDTNLTQLKNFYPFTKYSDAQLELAPHSVKELFRVESLGADVTGQKSAYTGTRLLDVGVSCYVPGIGADWVYLRGATTKNQAVYEMKYGNLPDQYIAVGVKLQDVPGTHWFKIPSHIEKEKYSDWFGPVSTEPASTNQAQMVLVSGGPMPMYPVERNAPKIRVQLHNFSESHDEPSNDYFPATYTAWEVSRANGSTDPSSATFLEPLNGDIPSCGDD